MMNPDTGQPERGEDVPAAAEAPGTAGASELEAAGWSSAARVGLAAPDVEPPEPMAGVPAVTGGEGPAASPGVEVPEPGALTTDKPSVDPFWETCLAYNMPPQRK